MKQLTFILLSLLFTQFAFAKNGFKYNNKNLNALGAIICLMQESDSKNIKSHQINIDKKRVGAKSEDLIFEISGTCNNEISHNSDQNILGEEFAFTFKKDRENTIHGKIGIKEIQITFKNSTPIKIEISDPLLLTKTQKDISNTQWSTTNQIFNFGKEKFRLKLDRKVAATEDSGVLNFKEYGTTFYNLWSESTFGCTQAGKFISQQKCGEINTTSF